jgi:hypothetical protein
MTRTPDRSVAHGMAVSQKPWAIGMSSARWRIAPVRSQ